LKKNRKKLNQKTQKKFWCDPLSAEGTQGIVPNSASRFLKILEKLHFLLLPQHADRMTLNIFSTAYNPINNAYVAIKKINNPFHNREHARQLYREIFLLRNLKHPNIVDFVEAYTSATCQDHMNDMYQFFG
jgi:serine/threonine protein kinase